MTEQSRTVEALDYLNQLREASDRLDHASYSRLHDLISAIAEPAACICTGHSEDRGGGHFELVIEPDPGCPEHGAAITALQKLSEHPLDGLQDGTHATARAISYAKTREESCAYSHELSYCTKCGWVRPPTPRVDYGGLLARLTANVDPLAVECGACGAKPETRCSGNGSRNRPHPSREVRAERELRAEAADAIRALNGGAL